MNDSIFRRIISVVKKLTPENFLYFSGIMLKEFRGHIEKCGDLVLGSAGKKFFHRGELIPLEIIPEKLDLSGIDKIKIEELSNMYMAHMFDLLGSGWTKVGYGQKVKGFESYKYENKVPESDREGIFLDRLINRSNLHYSKRIWKMIEGEYDPIDWQRDFISGYRWKNAEWYKSQKIADKPGGDIKVPWELSRMQHLPRLAILYLMFPCNRNYIREFRNQMLDFIATNPVRFGVNFACTMDVGIRTANVALAYSLFRKSGVTFDKQFEHVMCNFFFEHCDFIRNNLEWSKFLTSNHYFADICGLLWGSSVLPECKLKNKWMCFAADEINKEVCKQFHEEGSNGEGSTAYHRLTSEMAVYSLALMTYLERKGYSIEIDKKAFTVISGSADFMRAIIRPDGMFTQVGDNDSGLFFRLSITGDLITNIEAKDKYRNLGNYSVEIEKPYLDENMNDCRTFISASKGLFDAESEESVDLYPLEYSLTRQFANDIFKGFRDKKGDTCNYDLCSSIDRIISKYELKHHKSFYIDSKGLDLTINIKRVDYDQFGLYIFRGDHIYLCVNASDNGQKGNAGHAHNDKLSFELFVDGECIFEDPGTYVYTSYPNMRNKYRSVESHNTIYSGIEQNEFNGLFSMIDETKCRVISRNDHSIILFVSYHGVIHMREFIIRSSGIEINDWCNMEFVQHFSCISPITRGYGKVLK